MTETNQTDRDQRVAEILAEIREEILPDLDDAFAQSISDKYESLEVLKTKIRENLSDGYAKRVEQELNE